MKFNPVFPGAGVGGSGVKCCLSDTQIGYWIYELEILVTYFL